MICFSTFFLILLNCSHLLAQEPLQYKNVHGHLPAPFKLILPSSFSSPNYLRKRKTPKRSATNTGTLTPSTAVTIPPDHDFTQPWVKTSNGFVAFDAFTESSVLATEKVAVSSARWGSLCLKATLRYTNNKNFSFKLEDEQTVLMERQCTKGPLNHLGDNPVGLYTIHDHEGAIIGWCVLHGTQLIFAFPHIGDDGRLRVFSYHIQGAQPGTFETTDAQGNLRWSLHGPQPKESIITTTPSANMINVWGYKTIRVAPHSTVNFTIPALYRITLPTRNNPPSLQEIAPPDEISAWPDPALHTWSPVRLFLASVVHNLSNFKSQILCSIPQEFWTYARNKSPLSLAAFAHDKNIKTLVQEEIDILRSYLPNIEIGLESLLLVTPPSLHPAKENKPSRIMVVLDAD